VGRGARPAVHTVSEEERFSKLHCGCCMKPLPESRHKAVNEGATHWVCSKCDQELRARGEQDITEVWKCPSAAKGKSGCLCWSAKAKKQKVGGGKRPKSRAG
jgi:hypothetical protein